MRERLQNVQSLRGVACLAVVAYHTANVERFFGLGFNPLKPLMWCGYAGVDLFFVLSGFIIATTCRRDLGEPQALPRYLFRRAWRIYPTYWAALVLAAAVYPLQTGSLALDRPGEVADTLLLLPQVGMVPRLIPVAWTLSYELLFYAAFGALFLLPKRLALPALGAWAAAVLAGIGTGFETTNRFLTLAASPLVVEFLIGAALAWWPARVGGRSAAALVAVAAAWATVASAVYFHPNPDHLPLMYPRRLATFGVPCGVLVFALTAWERRGGLLPGRWLRAVGDASYSVYLLHLAFLFLVLYGSVSVGWSHRKAPHVAWVAVALTGSVLPGLLFYRWVEKPLLEWARSWRAGDVSPLLNGKKQERRNRGLTSPARPEPAATPEPTPAAPPGRTAHRRAA